MLGVPAKTSELSGAPAAFWSTLSAVAGGVSGLFAQPGTTFSARLTIAADSHPADDAGLLTPGRTVEAVVRFAPASAEHVVRTVCIKVPDAYGPGRDQDFLLATSADGIPFHHAALPAHGPTERLYSSLWLYLAGIRPVVFGLRADARGGSGVPALGDTFSFLVAGLLSRFDAVGTLELGEQLSGARAEFSAGNSGGGLRPLPPAMFYRG